ncbi:MAG: DnaJ domain-containing protein [Chloroflexi bacterium]|nr:DnaJ domain-containing protein [Chloroflexota bacterium]
MLQTPIHYQILQVPIDASQEDINRAYRRLARQFHPDLHPLERREWAEEQMKQLNKAYEVLDDPDTRARYDATIGLRTGAPPHTKPHRKSPSPPFPEEWFTQDPFSKFFSRITSARWQRHAAFAYLLFDILTMGFFAGRSVLFTRRGAQSV